VGVAAARICAGAGGQQALERLPGQSLRMEEWKQDEQQEQECLGEKRADGKPPAPGANAALRLNQTVFKHGASHETMKSVASHLFA